MAIKSGYAVVRIRKGEVITSDSISEDDIFFTMAINEADALAKARDIGWRTSSYSAATPNPYYEPRKTLVESTLGSMIRYFTALSPRDMVHEYIATRVTIIGDRTLKGAKPYIMVCCDIDTLTRPLVVCCYATSYSEMVAMLSTSGDYTVTSLMSRIKMRFYPSNVIVLSNDPFRDEEIPHIYAAVPRGISPVVVDDSGPVPHSYALDFPGPAHIRERGLELV